MDVCPRWLDFLAQRVHNKLQVGHHLDVDGPGHSAWNQLLEVWVYQLCMEFQFQLSQILLAAYFKNPLLVGFIDFKPSQVEARFILSNFQGLCFDKDGAALRVVQGKR